MQLTHQKIRFLVALGGIVFIITLLFMQLGFQDALYKSATQVHNTIKGDLFLISSQYKALTSQQSFPRSRLYQALGFDGVQDANFLYVQFAKFKNPETGQKFPIYVLGIDPATSAFNLSGVEKNLDVIKVANTVLFDEASRPEFGPIVKEFSQGKVLNVELYSFNEQVGSKIKIGGLFALGPSFGVDGNLIVNYLTLLELFADRKADKIDIGLLTLKPGADIRKVMANLSANLPKDVEVITRKEFVALEKGYWANRTPIGFVFNLSVTMAFIIGTAIVYQILYTNITNHLVEYATLKAMGFKNNYLLRVVFQQAMILSLVGYIPGFIIALGLYKLASKETQLPVEMNLHNGIIVLTSGVLMCIFSGAVAIGKLRAADPADIF
jgi:putative ABC transport system permease protein